LDKEWGHQLNGFMINVISMDAESTPNGSDGHSCASQKNYDKEIHAKFLFLRVFDTKKLALFPSVGFFVTLSHHTSGSMMEQVMLKYIYTTMSRRFIE